MRLSQWQCSRSYGVHCPLCSLCLLSRPGHFDVNGYSDECVSFTGTLLCKKRVRVGWTRFYSYLCVQTRMWAYTRAHIEPWISERSSFPNTVTVCWVEFSHCTVLSPNMLVKFFETTDAAQAWESCKRIQWTYSVFPLSIAVHFELDFWNFLKCAYSYLCHDNTNK